MSSGDLTASFFECGGVEAEGSTDVSKAIENKLSGSSGQQVQIKPTGP
jgi:hypothetical protein